MTKGAICERSQFVCKSGQGQLLAASRQAVSEVRLTVGATIGRPHKAIGGQ